MLLLVFAKQIHLPYIRNIQTTYTRTGIFGYWVRNHNGSPAQPLNLTDNNALQLCQTGIPLAAIAVEFKYNVKGLLCLFSGTCNSFD